MCRRFPPTVRLMDHLTVGRIVSKKLLDPFYDHGGRGRWFLDRTLPSILLGAIAIMLFLKFLSLKYFPTVVGSTNILLPVLLGDVSRKIQVTLFSLEKYQNCLRKARICFVIITPASRNWSISFERYRWWSRSSSFNSFSRFSEFFFHFEPFTTSPYYPNKQ